MAAKKTTAKKATAKKSTAKKPTAKKPAPKKAAAKKPTAKTAAAPGDRMTKAATRARGVGQRLIKAGETMEKVADKVDTLVERVKNRPRLLKRRKK